MKKLWITYIAVGLGAFLISFSMEFIIFQSITGMPYFSFFLTLVLECGKVLTVIFHRFVSDKKGYTIPDIVNFLNTFFKFGLVFLSLVCSIALISKGLDRPNLDSVKQKDEIRIKNTFDENLSIIKSQRQQRLDNITTEIKQKYEKRYQELNLYYLPKISSTEKLRDDEFRNIQGGVRKGPFWHEYDRQLKDYKNEFKQEKNKLLDAENMELNKHISKIENDFQKKLDNSLDDKGKALASVNTNEYKDDERAKNVIIASFLMTMDQGLNLEIEYLTFALLLSLLVSVLLEVTIYLTFSYVVMFYNNILSPAKEELVYVNQVNPVPHVENDNTETYEEPISENLYAQSGIDPSMDEFYQDLQKQFHPSDIPKNNDDNPCEKSAEEVYHGK